MYSIRANCSRQFLFDDFFSDLPINAFFLEGLSLTSICKCFRTKSCRNYLPLFLFLLLWGLGLILGFVSASGFDGDSFSLVRSALISRLSIVSVISAGFFPIVVTGVAIAFSARFLLLPLSFVKSYCLAFCMRLISCCFFDAAWVVSLLILFPGVCTVVPLAWLWIRFLSGGRVRRNDFFMVLAFVLFVSAINVYFVTPVCLGLF